MSSSEIIRSIYFPFTTISASTAEMLRTCLGAFSMYCLSEDHIHSHMKEGFSDGWLDIRFPVNVEKQQIELMVRDFQAWTNHHKGGILSYLKAQTNRPPFFDDSAASQVAKEIRNSHQAGAARDSSVLNEDNDLMQAVLFLHAAASFDMQTEDIIENLEHFEIRQQDFISDLREEDDSLFLKIMEGHKTRDEDTGHFMTGERIKFWSKLMGCDPSVPELFVTSSAAVLTYLLDRASDTVRVAEWGPIPLDPSQNYRLAEPLDNPSIWQSHIHATIQKLLHATLPVSVENPEGLSMDEEGRPLFFLEIYLIPDQRPGNFFEILSGVPRPGAEKSVDYEAPANTLIGYVRQLLT